MVTKNLYMFDEGGKELKELLGGKGANLAEMTKIGLPVPYGFILSTEVCRQYMVDNKLSDQVLNEIKVSVEKLEDKTGKKFGDLKNPLLVSVRSGAPVSMPGMMDTVLNLGMNDEVVETVSENFKCERFAYESYSRFIEMFADIVMKVEREKFVKEADKLLAKFEGMNTAEFYRERTKKYKEIYKKELNQDFPQNPLEQMQLSIEAIFKSWNNERAKIYRELHDIDEKMGTAVNVQQMVFGNLNEISGTGVVFTRNPATGENKIYGEYLLQAQGEDIVAGIRTPETIETLKKSLPKIYDEFVLYAKKLENHYRDMQDIEFTIEDGKLYILQTRNGKRSIFSAVRVAVELVKEKLITEEEALLRINPKDVSQILLGSFTKKSIEKAELLGSGLAGSAGVAMGKAILSSEKVNDKDSILVRTETSPDDLRGMSIAMGILTARGGLTSHGAVVARGMGKCCVAGCEQLEIDLDKREFKIGNKKLKEGDYISIDGYSGNIYSGRLTIEEGNVQEDFKTFLEFAKKYKRLGVRMNADTPADVRAGLSFGAEGVGLCRTEHMFFKGERIWAIREMILSEELYEREHALEKILPYQVEDFIEMFSLMGDKPVNIRLLDPPLHEFLPQTKIEIRKMANIIGIPMTEVTERIDKHMEHNPMLGHRGCRLAVTFPEIYEMQVRAIMQAINEVQKTGKNPHVEIMVPIVGDSRELAYVRKKIQGVIDEVETEMKADYSIGTMIELPRACIVADFIATEAEFFSFGTNDLTQTSLGLSRDDTAPLIQEYLRKGIYTKNPFETLDSYGVGGLMKHATTLGRDVNPNLKIGICGEHGGDPDSIKFCNDLGLDYVSCSPYRVPLAIIAAAQCEIRRKKDKTEEITHEAKHEIKHETKQNSEQEIRQAAK
ncbi:MAG: pyruvate, phosphate dikinase [Fusobacteriaceae bacterium]